MNAYLRPDIRSIITFLGLFVFLAACQPVASPSTPATPTATRDVIADSTPTVSPLMPTPLPTRAGWRFGELLAYTSQGGDWLPVLAKRFSTEPETILEANPGMQIDENGLIAPGQALVIPASYLPLPGLAGTPFRIIPDSELVYGPGLQDWDTAAYLEGTDGWLKDHVETADGALRSAAEVIDRLAERYSLNPRLLLALIEYRSGLVTGGHDDEQAQTYPLGYQKILYNGLNRQLLWTARQLDAGYYGWRIGNYVEVTLQDDRGSRLDPWQNAGTAALHYLFAQWMDSDAFEQAVSPEGFAATYQALFGDPFALEAPLFSLELAQPELTLPFPAGETWSYTGGPHPAWDPLSPLWSAVDIAPPAVAGGCGYSSKWAIAIASGLVIRSGENSLLLDLDGDGDEGTGWVIFYLHLSGDYVVPVGTWLEAGDPVGHPSCEGGRSTGTHVHFARKYNGEWLAADGMIPLELSGWQVHSDGVVYQGRMTYEFPALEIRSCECVADNTLSW